MEEKLKSWHRIAKCKFCGNEFVTTKYKLEKNSKGVFCSRKCYADYKQIEMRGSNNPRFVEKEHLKCENCGKEFDRIPSISFQKNRFGEIHNFCSHKCYGEFRKRYYIGEKNFHTGKILSDETKNKLRECTLKQLSSHSLDCNTKTKPQLAINHLLDEMNIEYINEYPTKYYSIDNFLPSYNLMIEVMGDYFHANPIVYNNGKVLYEIQRKNIIRDKRKHTYIKKYYHIEILYLWESDINSNIELCKNLIIEYINNNGELNDYQSFNFSLYNEKLIQNQNIINPYFLTPLND